MANLLSVGTFDVDATPPLGTPLCHGAVRPATKVVGRLSARGLVLTTDDSPIVLCAVDWVCISNGGYKEWQHLLAEAAGTTMDRVSVHTVHPHDTPGCDFSAEEFLESQGLSGQMFNANFARDTIKQTAKAVKIALDEAQPITHLGIGKAKVDKFASNRRVIDGNGKVKCMRHTRCGWGPNNPCTCEVAQSAPEGTIDPYVRNISFWNSEKPLVSLTYYATHPQSFYGRGAVSADTIGIARSLREATLPDVHHIHFDGAGGNVGPGKYNDGSPGKRLLLAERLAKGMEDAWEVTVKVPITVRDVEWRTRRLALPLSQRLAENEEGIKQVLMDKEAELCDRIRAARDLAWISRCKAGDELALSVLRLGTAYVLHMPSELFVEYQLAAQKEHAGKFICIAAYGDCGPGYIGTEKAYYQGGYETDLVSRVAPETEEVLMDHLRML